jgi:hypothetical protein
MRIGLSVMRPVLRQSGPQTKGDIVSIAQVRGAD